jgi:hypothetical protein
LTACRELSGEAAGGESTTERLLADAENARGLADADVGRL